jgi:hypothetical protein
MGFAADEGIKFLVYGRSKSGKTTTWGTFPKPALALICSGGGRPGELRSIDTPENRKSIRQVVIRETDEIKAVTDAVASGALDVKTLVLDHASGLQDQVLMEILGLDEAPVQRTWGLASQQQYGQCTLRCKELLRGMLSLPCNVVVVAQERTFDSESESDLIMPTVGAGLTPSLTSWLNTAVDYIGQTFIRQKEGVKKTKMTDGKVVETKVRLNEVEYCLRVGPHPVYTTGFRVPAGRKLPDAIVNPDYNKIMGLIRGGAPGPATP